MGRDSLTVKETFAINFVQCADEHSLAVRTSISYVEAASLDGFSYSRLVAYLDEWDAKKAKQCSREFL